MKKRKKAPTRAERDQLAKLIALPDDKIDISDIPEAPAESWMHARLTLDRFNISS